MSQQRIVVANWEENNCNVKRTAIVLGLSPGTVSRHLKNAGLLEQRKSKDYEPIGRTVNDKALTTGDDDPLLQAMMRECEAGRLTRPGASQ